MAELRSIRNFVAAGSLAFVSLKKDMSCGTIVVMKTMIKIMPTTTRTEG